MRKNCSLAVRTDIIRTGNMSPAAGQWTLVGEPTSRVQCSHYRGCMVLGSIVSVDDIRAATGAEPCLKSMVSCSSCPTSSIILYVGRHAAGSRNHAPGILLTRSTRSSSWEAAQVSQPKRLRYRGALSWFRLTRWSDRKRDAARKSQLLD
jgi:hypothetical protein